MTRYNVTVDNPNEYTAGPFAQSCNGTLYYHRYAAVYEVQGAHTVWWTHGIGSSANVYYNPGQCNCSVIAYDPFGNPIEACAPQPRIFGSNANDYVANNGSQHYFIGYGANGAGPIPTFLLSDS